METKTMRRRVYGAGALLIGTVLVASGSGTAQVVRSVGERASCSGCIASLSPVMSLGDPSDPAGFAPLLQVARNTRGMFVVSSPTFAGELFVYDHHGHFLRSLGRRGEGPGEFTGVQLLAFDQQDSLHAVTQGGNRYTVLPPDLHSTARSTLLAARVMEFRLVRDRGLFALAPTIGPEGGFALQLLSRDGKSIHAFDALNAGAKGQAALGRHLAVAPDGSMWSVEVARYRIRGWSEWGRAVLALEGRRDWMPQTFPERLNPAVQRPLAQIGGLATDEAGRLWLFFVVADARWHPSPRGNRLHPNQLFDTIIEVIDLGSGKLFTTGRTDQLVLPFQRGYAYSTIEDAQGDLKIQIWRMDVKDATDDGRDP